MVAILISLLFIPLGICLFIISPVSSWRSFFGLRITFYHLDEFEVNDFVKDANIKPLESTEKGYIVKDEDMTSAFTLYRNGDKVTYMLESVEERKPRARKIRKWLMGPYYEDI